MFKILVVDDESELCLFIKKVLEGTGEYEVCTTTVPEEVLRLSCAEKPDLILLDNVMPSMKGTEIVKLLKNNSQTRHILVVITSGMGEMVYHEKKNEWKWEPNRDVVLKRGDVINEKNAVRAAQAYGVDDFISKPFSQQTLLSVVADVLHRLREEDSESI